MAALGAHDAVEVTPNAGVKLLTVTTAATADAADTLTVDLTKYGCTNIHGIVGFTESTTGSVVVTEAPSTAVSSGTLTITIGGSTDNKVRSFLIWAY